MSLTIESSFLWNETVWNPSMISTVLWLDAADANTITTVSGAVSQWNDKSGNGRNATQGTPGSRPTYTETTNGRNVITFDGSDDTLSTSAFTFSSTDLSSCCVFRTTSTNAEGIWGGQSGSLNRIGLFFTGANNLRSHQNDLGTIEVPGYSTNAYVMVTTSRSGTAVGQFRNGTQVGSGTSTPDTAASMAISVGSFANNTVGSFPGQFAELVIFSSNELNRQRVEGYLAHKWGLEANLPAGHPYKNYGPKP